MLRLASILYSLISTSLAGSFIVVALVTGYTTLMPIIYAAAAGFVLALPVSWAVSKQLYDDS
ncbi:CTP synthetase [Lutimaribacter sp. EGI FJ00015]|uniref:CTP synthetase n=1 Tax=Lutimaribacter degradans TaxID=2945989 RepID=A0ACC5ZUG3_9RHOB|nr:CTP synthetase [Lutimaribacter sp. EGI FJ00013]MCM2561588.1 CTP synthetase [Lutimaribacter sp. EGI FJ00013]MCO0612701.1 CTP synthetase [Lutimaribacter sp. EGI FJ00015]MCO0635359.1 CTP synthetase [Lutimaribacter sp. EGI FJ00014]